MALNVHVYVHVHVQVRSSIVSDMYCDCALHAKYATCGYSHMGGDPYIWVPIHTRARTHGYRYLYVWVPIYRGPYIGGYPRGSIYRGPHPYIHVHMHMYIALRERTCTCTCTLSANSTSPGVPYFWCLGPSAQNGTPHPPTNVGPLFRNRRGG